MHATSTSVLQADKDWLTNQNMKLRCELQLTRQTMDLHAKRNNHQAHVIWNANKKVVFVSLSTQNL